MIAWVAAAIAGPCLDPAVELRPDDPLVTVGTGVTEAVFALGAGERVVATDTTSAAPPEVGQLPKVGYARQLSPEGVLATGARALLASEDAGPPAALGRLAAAGARVCLVRSPTDAEGVLARLTAVGDALGRPEAAAKLVAQVRAELSAIPAPTRARRVLFVYARGSGSLQVAGTGTSAEAMIRLAGGIPAVTAWDGYRPLTAEGLIAAAPDVILVTTTGLASLGGIEGALAAPGVALTPAGRSRAVLAMEDAFLLGMGPRTGTAAAELRRLLEGVE